MSLGNAWSGPLNFASTQLPQLPAPQLYSLNQPRDLPSQHTFVPHAEIPQLHYGQDPRLTLKIKLHCSLRSNLSVNNSFQLTARNRVNCETGIHSAAQNIPASPPPPPWGKSHTQILPSPLGLDVLSPG
jgi:hypothetical protein